MTTPVELDTLVAEVNTLTPYMVRVGWDCTDGSFSLDTYSWDVEVNSLVYPSIEELYAALQGMITAFELAK